MNRRTLVRLWANTELVTYIKGQAARHFSCTEDREDAAIEAWEKIAALRGHPTLEYVHKCAHRAIAAMYRREYRRTRRSVST